MLFSSKVWEIIILVFLAFIVITYVCVAIYTISYQRKSDLKDEFVEELNKMKDEILEEITHND